MNDSLSATVFRALERGKERAGCFGKAGAGGKRAFWMERFMQRKIWLVQQHATPGSFHRGKRGGAQGKTHSLPSLVDKRIVLFRRADLGRVVRIARRAQKRDAQAGIQRVVSKFSIVDHGQIAQPHPALHGIFHSIAWPLRKAKGNFRRATAGVARAVHFPFEHGFVFLPIHFAQHAELIRCAPQRMGHHNGRIAPGKFRADGRAKF